MSVEYGVCVNKSPFGCFIYSWVNLPRATGYYYFAILLVDQTW